jgi:hypothetical protein
MRIIFLNDEMKYFKKSIENGNRPVITDTG